MLYCTFVGVIELCLLSGKNTAVFRGGRGDVFGEKLENGKIACNEDCKNILAFSRNI